MKPSLSADTYKKGKWVLVDDRVPKTHGIKIILTDNNAIGLASYVDDEWIQFLPTFVGNVRKWCEFLDEGGQEYDVNINEPEPELCGGV